MQVVRVQRYVEDHAFELDLDVASACRACRIADHNISCRFATHLGIGIRRYIEEVRLTAAETLLRCSEAHVYLIADCVGYSGVESFTRAFKRTRGVSPEAWRRRHRSRTTAS